MTSTADQAGIPVRDVMTVLASARAARQTADAAEVQLLVDAVDWAVANPPVFARDADAAYVSLSAAERPERVPLNGEGVPEVDRAAVAEYGLALGWSTQAAQALIADALELAFRLPTLWTRVVAGEVVCWRARRVAQATRVLPKIAAQHVDRQVAPVAHRLGGPALDRLVQTALTRHDRERALQIAEERREQRHFNIDLENTSLSGLTSVGGRIEMPDAEDLDAALAHAAEQLAAWGSTESLGVRRARALGDLARQHLTWNGEPTPTTWRAEDLNRADEAGAGAAGGAAAGAAAGSGQVGAVGSDPAGGGPAGELGSVASEHAAAGSGGGSTADEPQPSADTSADTGPGAGAGPLWRVPPRRQVVLYLHLSDTALLDQLARGRHTATGSSSSRCGGASESGEETTTTEGPVAFGRVENTGTPVTADVIRDWCSDPRTNVSIRPVLDVLENLHADGYEVPPRLREQVRLRDGTCIFPGCQAKGLYCQDDHCDPYNHDRPDEGGQTESCNLRLLCQRHHTLKTHHGFSYTILANGAVLWRTPRGLRIRRNRDGTTSMEGLPEAGRHNPVQSSATDAASGASASDPGRPARATEDDAGTPRQQTFDLPDPPDPPDPADPGERFEPPEP